MWNTASSLPCCLTRSRRSCTPSRPVDFSCLWTARDEYSFTEISFIDLHHPTADPPDCKSLVFRKKRIQPSACLDSIGELLNVHDFFSEKMPWACLDPVGRFPEAKLSLSEKKKQPWACPNYPGGLPTIEDSILHIKQTQQIEHTLNTRGFYLKPPFIS